MTRRLVLAAVLLCASIAEARDRAVLIYPRERSLFRRIFYTTHQAKLRHELSRRYDVATHVQISTERDLFSIDIEGARLLIISAHGDPFAMYFAGRGERTLDSSDREKLEAFFAQLDENATIVLQSCHTGRGFAHLVKQAAGPHRRVIAARGEIPWDGVQVTSLEPFDARILCGVGAEDRWDCTLRLR